MSGRTIDVKVRLREDFEPELYEYFAAIPSGWRAEILRLALGHARDCQVLPDMGRVWEALGARPVLRHPNSLKKGVPRKPDKQDGSGSMEADGENPLSGKEPGSNALPQQPSGQQDDDLTDKLIEKMMRINRFG